MNPKKSSLEELKKNLPKDFSENLPKDFSEKVVNRILWELWAAFNPTTGRLKIKGEHPVLQEITMSSSPKIYQMLRRLGYLNFSSVEEYNEVLKENARSATRLSNVSESIAERIFEEDSKFRIKGHPYFNKKARDIHDQLKEEGLLDIFDEPFINWQSKVSAGY